MEKKFKNTSTKYSQIPSGMPRNGIETDIDQNVINWNWNDFGLSIVGSKVLCVYRLSSQWCLINFVFVFVQ